MPRIKVMTLHLRGDRADWAARRDRLLLFLQSEEVDVLLLQDIDERPWRLSQAEEIAYLTGFGMAFAPAHGFFLWPAIGNGLAILSRFPMSNLLTREIFRPPGLLAFSSPERRISHRIELGMDGLTVVIYNTHFPADAQARLSAATRLWAQVAQEEAVLVIVAGDFCAVPQERAITFLQGREPLANQRGQLVDAWRTAGIGPPETFPSHTPRERVDYVFYQAEPSVVIQEARVVGRRPMEMSDHAAVIATFTISRGAEYEQPAEDQPIATLEPTGGGKKGG